MLLSWFQPLYLWKVYAGVVWKVGTCRLSSSDACYYKSTFSVGSKCKNTLNWIWYPLRVYKISSWARVTEKSYIIGNWYGIFEQLRPLLPGGETSLHWSRLNMNCEQHRETNAGEEMCCLTKDVHQDTQKMGNEKEWNNLFCPFWTLRGY